MPSRRCRSDPAAPTPAAPGPAPRCTNCGAAAPDRFCGSCGQERRSLRVPIHRLAGEALGEALSADSRLARTLAPLLLRPGAVTRAYLDGRRARFTSPVKLYLLASFLFFLVQALAPGAPRVAVMGADATPERSVGVAVDGLEELRGAGPWGARVADRLEALVREPPQAVRRRVSAGLAENVPRAMFFLVPVMAVLLRLLHLRGPVYLAEHLVFAIHAHVVAFVLLVPGAALGSAGAQAAGFAAACVHVLLAMRRVYGRGWLGTAVRAGVLVLLYLVALGIALAAAAAAALLGA